MTDPNVYVRGGRPRINLNTVDTNGNSFIPTEARLSIEQPDGEIFTVSGEGMVQASGISYYLYRPTQIGWYEYEAWVKDGYGFEDTDRNGFEVIDTVLT
jgi:hypothetical protein